jgi:hypothetical protein
MLRIRTLLASCTLGLAAAAPASAQGYGPERGREAVQGSDAVSDPTLRDVETRVPEEAKPAIRRAREAGRDGRERALDNIGREPERGRPDFGRPFGAPGPAGGPPSGGGFPGGGPGGRPGR